MQKHAVKCVAVLLFGIICLMPALLLAEKGSFSLEGIQVRCVQDEVRAYFSPMREGSPVVFQKKDSAKLFVNGVELAGKPVSQPAKSPMRYAILLDVSGSVNGRPLLEAQKAAETLVAAMPEQDKVAIYTFSDALSPLSSFSGDHEMAISAIRGVKNDGRRTELYFAIYTLIEKLAGEQAVEPTSIVIFSDGKDEGSSYTLDNAIDKARGASLILSGVGSSKINRKYLLTLEKMSRDTGGYYASAGGGLGNEDGAHKLLGHFSNRVEAAFSLRNLPPGVSATTEASLVVSIGGEIISLPVVLRGLIPPPPLPLSWYKKPSVVVVFLLLLLAGGGMVIMFVRRRKAVQGQPRLVPCPKCMNSFDPSLRECPHCNTPESPETVLAQWGVLQGNSPELAGWQYELRQGRYSIGAEDSNDIVIPDPTVSRSHASIYIKDGCAYVVDLKSKNGTRLNNQKITAAELTDGCELRFGSAQITFFFTRR